MTQFVARGGELQAAHVRGGDVARVPDGEPGAPREQCLPLNERRIQVITLLSASFFLHYFTVAPRAATFLTNTEKNWSQKMGLSKEKFLLSRARGKCVTYNYIYSLPPDLYDTKVNYPSAINIVKQL